MAERISDELRYIYELLLPQKRDGHFYARGKVRRVTYNEHQRRYLIEIMELGRTRSRTIQLRAKGNGRLTVKRSW